MPCMQPGSADCAVSLIVQFIRRSIDLCHRICLWRSNAERARDCDGWGVFLRLRDVVCERSFFSSAMMFVFCTVTPSKSTVSPGAMRHSLCVLKPRLVTRHCAGTWYPRTIAVLAYRPTPRASRRLRRAQTDYIRLIISVAFIFCSMVKSALELTSLYDIISQTRQSCVRSCGELSF